jgi:2-desacetyl-2-hydroxyethyl bacteriochlorophyllide A dehydrogenase
VFTLLSNRYTEESRLKAVTLQNGQLIFSNNACKPACVDGEALVRVHLAGICGTDLQLQQGYYPFEGILGHEFVGHIEEVKSQPDLQGKRVVGEINITCGYCSSCMAGNSSHCDNRSVLGILNKHGAFAEYLTLPVKNLHLLPDTIPDEEAVFIEPLAAALEIQQQISLGSNHKVLVVGAGKLGQIIARTLKLTGCDLTVVSRYQCQNKMLLQESIQSIHEKDIPEKQMDVVIEATGSPQGLILACQAVRPKGTVVLKSTYKQSIPVALNFSEIVVNEITIIGSRCGPFNHAIQLLAEKKLSLSSLISTTCSLEEPALAFKQASEPGIFKVLFEI